MCNATKYLNSDLRLSVSRRRKNVKELVNQSSQVSTTFKPSNLVPNKQPARNRWNALSAVANTLANIANATCTDTLLRSTAKQVTSHTHAMSRAAGVCSAVMMQWLCTNGEYIHIYICLSLDSDVGGSARDEYLCSCSISLHGYIVTDMPKLT